ncbi:hypothetical protein PspLS_10839 [Pyricularia sp. CBS 133598]|nr:hypothetical protein PspLS_10839 [Pyricularia sp. CBS 133598]
MTSCLLGARLDEFAVAQSETAITSYSIRKIVNLLLVHPHSRSHATMISAFLLGLAAVGDMAWASPAPNFLQARQADPRCNAATFTSSPSWPSYAAVSAGPITTNISSTRTACYLRVSLRPPGSTNNFTVGIALPDRAIWQSNAARFLAVGNGAYVPVIPDSDIAYGAALGFATAGTDTGHAGYDPLDLSWAEDPDKLIDFAYRSMDYTVSFGKTLTRIFYETETLGRTYYAGCSTGGRQGLKQVQDHPDSVDGALIGAPAWDHKHYLPWVGKVGSYQVDLPDADRLNKPWQLRLLTDLAIGTCDIQAAGDPVDGVISHPENCNPDLNSRLCGEGQIGNETNPCLTPVQTDIARKMYADYRLDDGTFVYERVYPGSEQDWINLTSDIALTRFDTQYQQHFLDRNDPLNPPIQDWARYEDNIARISARQDPGNVTADNFAGFAAYRGKILMYHGQADGVIPPAGSDRLYRSARQAVTGSETGDITAFFRFFQVPNMRHCFSSVPDERAPWWLGAANQVTVPIEVVPPELLTGAENALVALVDWVEGRSQGPEQVVTTSFDNVTGAIYAQRPVCLFDRKAAYLGGDLNVTTSWTCDRPGLVVG